MAMGKTVIGTSSSFLTIRGAVPWKHMVVSKDKKEFIENIAFLLKNGVKNRVIGKNARNLIEKNYQWSTTISMYEKIILMQSLLTKMAILVGKITLFKR